MEMTRKYRIVNHVHCI